MFFLGWKYSFCMHLFQLMDLPLDFTGGYFTLGAPFQSIYNGFLGLAPKGNSSSNPSVSGAMLVSGMVTLFIAAFGAHLDKTLVGNLYPRGSMYGIFTYIYHINLDLTQMYVNIPVPWILWELENIYVLEFFTKTKNDPIRFFSHLFFFESKTSSHLWAHLGTLQPLPAIVTIGHMARLPMTDR